MRISFKFVSLVIGINTILIASLVLNPKDATSQVNSPIAQLGIPKIDINDLERELDNCVSGGCNPSKLDPNKVIGDTLGLKSCHSAHDYVKKFNSGRGNPLTESQKNYLSPFFGNIVDQVRIHWVSHLPPSAVEPAAQTFGNNIYMAGAKARKELDTLQIILIGHEIVHSKQYKRHGGLSGFCKKYAQEWLSTGFNYNHMPLENEARNIAFQFAQYLGDKYQAKPGFSYVYTHEGINNNRTTLVPQELPVVLSDEYQCGIAGCQKPPRPTPPVLSDEYLCGIAGCQKRKR